MRRLLFLLAALLFLSTAGVSHAQVAVIAHQDVSVDAANAETLKDIYLLEQNKWDDGSEIVRFDLNSEGSTKTAFYDHVGQSVSDVKKVWLRKKLSGEAQPPEKVSSDQMIDKVSSTSAAIGYVPADAVTDAVKVIATIE
ncbi:hypothetical protein [Salinibacter ruber]|uniref:hypothetical protein n=1 Tax=Salinibacter ruber TaxID=146919 RepID=UPI00216915AE|nr:hypothetical protein [Salinibacter ruber]MCS3755385.1 ABC-type phosphate transport system substrate-binding protein [Salinibacter ruber]MCS3955056.1 ABC-type phosphate transport system substrate-binding protein [Salinibacter ruber]MCS4085350.1 ABC-type phosphate transport system substrate-binding protein [Salinibacter ruber]